MDLVSIAIVSADDGEVGRLVEEARSQSWGRKEILVAGPWEPESGRGTEPLREILVRGGMDLRKELVRRARGAWIQWLGEGERLSAKKIESQLGEAGAGSRDLLCAPYRLRMKEIAPVVDPRREPLSYVRRLGAGCPFVAPFLWSAKALRAFLRQGESALPGLRIGWGVQAACECPEEEGEASRAEWTGILAWALALASAGRAEEERSRAGRERLLSLLEEMDSSLARRFAESAERTDFPAKAVFRVRAAGESLRRAEALFRRGRRKLFHRIGLRKEAVPAAGEVPEREAYASWIAAYGELDGADREVFRRKIERFPRRPLLSVVMPVFNTPEKWLLRAIDSIRKQLYSEWELCIADDGSTAAHVRPLLERSRERDGRIRVAFRERSGGIAEASNTALGLARGEWIVLVDHDDELAEDAFYRVVGEILRDPEVRLLYSDEDKIDEEGRRFDPYFKPDFSYDFLLSENGINHLGVYQADLVRSLGGFRSGYDGSQDYDLALRFAEAIPSRRIRHIPRVLYHWRAIASSGAAREDAKPYAYEAARRAIADHLKRVGRPAEVLATSLCWGHRVRRALPAPPRVSVLLGRGQSEERFRRSIETVRARTDYPAYELVGIGRPAEGLPEGVRLLAPPEGMTGPCLWNWAAGQATGEVLVLLASPVEPKEKGWLEELVSQGVRPEVGAVGTRILAPDGTVAEAGVVVGLEGSAGAAFRGWSVESIGYFGQAILIRNPSAVSASCLVTRRTVFAECGGFDEGYRRELWDVDYCLRAGEKGYRVVFTPYAELVREETSGEVPEGDRERFRERWREWTQADPAYNPNLSLEEGYGLAWPPRRSKGCLFAALRG